MLVSSVVIWHWHTLWNDHHNRSGSHLSLLKVLLYSSILLLSSVSIFMIITLKSLLDKLLISTTFLLGFCLISMFGGLPWWLSWNVGDLGSFPGLEDPLQKGMATQASILAWRIPWTIVLVVTKSQTWLSDFHFFFVWNIFLCLISPNFLCLFLCVTFGYISQSWRCGVM